MAPKRNATSNGSSEATDRCLPFGAVCRSRPVRACKSAAVVFVRALGAEELPPLAQPSLPQTPSTLSSRMLPYARCSGAVALNILRCLREPRCATAIIASCVHLAVVLPGAAVSPTKPTARRTRQADVAEEFMNPRTTTQVGVSPPAIETRGLVLMNGPAGIPQIGASGTKADSTTVLRGAPCGTIPESELPEPVPGPALGFAKWENE